MYDSEKFGMLDLCQASERQMIYLRKQEIGYVSQFLRIMPRTTARQIIEQAVLEMGADEAGAGPLGYVSQYLFRRRKAAVEHCGCHGKEAAFTAAG